MPEISGIIGRRGDIAATSSPVGMEKFAARPVDAFIGMRTEIITLCLQQIGRQSRGPVAIKESQGAGHGWHRDALLDGYTRVRALSEEQLNNVDLFLAAFAVFWSLYAADVVQRHPEDREELFQRMARYFRLVEHYLANN